QSAQGVLSGDLAAHPAGPARRGDLPRPRCVARVRHHLCVHRRQREYRLDVDLCPPATDRISGRGTGVGGGNLPFPHHRYPDRDRDLGRPGECERRRRRAMSLKRVAGRIGFAILIAAIIFYALFPFYWAIVSSFKTGSVLFSVESLPV